MLSISDLRLVLGGRRVLDGFSAAVAPGHLTALVGPNGCGKSTLLKAVMGFLTPASGSILLDGVPIRTLSRARLARLVAYLPQEAHCPDYLSVGELVELGGYARLRLFGGPSSADRKRFGDALEAVGLTGVAGRRVNELSGGQRQRAWIALALAQDAPVLLLDEPVNHLDMRYQYELLDLVRGLAQRQGRTVVCVLHDMNLAAAFADDLVMMAEGRAVVAGPAASTLTGDNVARVFGFRPEIVIHQGRPVCLPPLWQDGSASPGGALAGASRDGTGGDIRGNAGDQG